MGKASKIKSKSNRLPGKSTRKIKYTDKSRNQPDLVPVFNAIVNLLTPYAKGSMKLIGGTQGKVLLISRKPVEISGKMRDELWFASALVQKGYVGFYFMPVYRDPEIRKLISPELLECLKGQACFHIKTADPTTVSQIREALKSGYGCWRRRGWL